MEKKTAEVVKAIAYVLLTLATAFAAYMGVAPKSCPEPAAHTHQTTK